MNLHNGQPPKRPARIYYGWILVATLAVTEITSWGVLYYAFTVFLDPMHATFGWSRASMAGAFSLALLLSGVVGIPLGHWLDRHGPRLLMVAGSFVAVLLLLAWSSVQTLAAFYLIWAGLGIAMAATLYEPAFWVVSTWFTRRRGQALTLLTLVAGLASVIYVPLAAWLVAAQGWRHALVSLAVVVAVGTLPAHAFVLRGHPPVASPDLAGQTPDAHLVSPAPLLSTSLGGRVVLRERTFWLLTTAFVLSTFGTGTLFVYLVPYFTARGYSAGTAASFVGVIGLIALPGRLVLTPVGDWLPRGWITAVLFGIQALSVVVLLVVPGTSGVIAFVVMFGAVFGAITPARAALVAEYYGPTHFGAINGVLAFALSTARGLAPIGAGVVTEWTGSYQAAFGGLAAFAAVAAIAALLADHRAVRLGLRARAHPVRAPTVPT